MYSGALDFVKCFLLYYYIICCTWCIIKCSNLMYVTFIYITTYRKRGKFHRAKLSRFRPYEVFRSPLVRNVVNYSSCKIFTEKLSRSSSKPQKMQKFSSANLSPFTVCTYSPCTRLHTKVIDTKTTVYLKSPQN